MALEEAEYKIYDETRAKAADELQWLDFEVKIRDMVKKMLLPVLSLSAEDRESCLEMEI